MGRRRRTATAVAALAVGVVSVAPAGAAAAAAEGVTVTDHVIPSFDGVPLEATLFLPEGATADAPVPLVLRTHGWGGSRERSLAGASDLDPGAGTLDRLLAEGYAVLTWDQRGFGCSGGQVRIDDPDVEGRDVSALIDWATVNAPIETDAAGDPVVGMTGGSYAGGIQTAAAAVDERLDALAPEISWADLRYSLYSGEVVNQGWVSLLYALGKSSAEGAGLSPECVSGPHVGGLDPAIDRGVVEFVTSGVTGPDTLEIFATSSLLAYGVDRPVTVPTLVLQGSVDTLFDLTDGHAIHEHVASQGVDSRFVAFCGGHVACPPGYADADDRAHLDDAIVTWFDRHLRGRDVDTGAPVEYRTNAGTWRTATSFPPPDATAVPVTGAADQLVAVPVIDVPDTEEALAALATPGGIPGLPITTSQASTDGDPRAATFPVAAAADGDLEVVGIPAVTLTASATAVPLETVLAPLRDELDDLEGYDRVGELLVGDLGPLEGIVAGLGGITALGGAADPAAHVVVKLVHRETGHVLNAQEGAVRVDANVGEVVLDVPMPGLAYTLPEGDHLDLQVSTASLMHATGRVPALVDLEVSGAVPVVGTAGAPTEDGNGPARGDGPRDDAPTSDADPQPDEATAVARAPVAGRDRQGQQVTARPVAATSELPATGGAAAGAGLVALLTAGALRRRAG